jgi:hypothetical protein
LVGAVGPVAVFKYNIVQRKAGKVDLFHDKSSLKWCLKGKSRALLLRLDAVPTGFPQGDQKIFGELRPCATDV